MAMLNNQRVHVILQYPLVSCYGLLPFTSSGSDRVFRMAETGSVLHRKLREGTESSSRHAMSHIPSSSFGCVWK